MPARVRLLTRRFDLSVEGENVGEVERLIGLLEERGLSPKIANVGSDVGSFSARNDTAPTMSMSDGYGPESVRVPSLGALEAFTSEGSSGAPQEAGAIRAVTKRQGEVYVLSPKFPPNVNGEERVEDAVMVLLGAFDAAGEGAVTGYYLVMALRQTGYSLSRVDKIVSNLEQKGLVLVSGTRRGRSYSLSESGRMEARRLASDLAAQAGRTVEVAP
jgi:hypothetical protein